MLTNEQRRRLTLKLSVPDHEEERELPPLDSEMEERLVASTRALLAEGGAAGANHGEQAERPAGALAQVIELNARREAASATRQARPAVRSGKRRLATVWRLATAGAMVAAASLALLWWGTAGPPLSPYALEVRSEVRHLGSTQLGGPPVHERVRLSTDSRVRLNLRPSEAVTGPLTVAAYKRRVGLELQRWPEGQPAEAESGGKLGLLTLDKSVQELHLTPGRWQLIYVVGRPRRLPSDEEVKSLVLTGERPTSDSQWQLRSIYVDIVDRP